MRKPTFVEINAFLVLAETLSFAKASTRLGISTPTLSGTIETLEGRLGVKLVERRERDILLTKAGEQLTASMLPVLKSYDSALESVNKTDKDVRGSIRIVTWGSYANNNLLPLVIKFSKASPDTAIEVSCVQVPDKIDLVAGNFDLGLDFGERIARDMIAIRMTGKIRTAMLGSPKYFERHSKPRSPQDLKDHDCIRLRLPDGTTLPWRTAKSGKDSVFSVDGRLIFNDVALSLTAALDGLGLTFGTYEFFKPFIADGSLVEILRDWAWQSDGRFLYYSSRRQIPPHVQAFINFIKKENAGRSFPDIT